MYILNVHLYKTPVYEFSKMSTPPTSSLKPVLLYLLVLLFLGNLIIFKET